MQRSEYAVISNKNRISPDEEAYAFKAEIDAAIGAANLEETTRIGITHSSRRSLVSEWGPDSISGAGSIWSKPVKASTLPD